MVDLLLVDVWGGPNYYPSLSIGYVASAARKAGFTCRIITPNLISDFSVEKFKHILTHEQPVFAGFAGYTMEMFNTYKLMKAVKEWNSFCKVILGGAHANALGEQVFSECAAVDVAFVFAEGEEGIVEYLKAKGDATDVKGTIYRSKDGGVVKNGSREFSKDIDLIAHPARDAYHHDEYHDVEIGGDSNFLEKPIHILVSSRGCPYRCVFCVKSFGVMSRRHSVSYVLDEIREIRGKHGGRELFFIDDLFAVNKKWVLEFCSALQKEGLVMPWKCLVRVDTVDEEMLRAMKNAGCHTASFGIETGNIEVMKWMRKGITLDQARRTIKIAKKVGINQELYFIIGHRVDSEKTINETIEFARELNGDFPRFFIFSPYPGSEVYESLPDDLKEPYWLEGTAEELRSSGNTSICAVSPERLNQLWHKAHDRAYSQLRYVTENVVPSFLENPFRRGWIRKLTNFVGFGVLRAHRLVYRREGQGLLEAVLKEWPKAFF
ncbi:MAG: B12-binding domain-containing radical SAM protein [Candidatus Micrarchaeia archaeon]